MIRLHGVLVEKNKEKLSLGICQHFECYLHFIIKTNMRNLIFGRISGKFLEIYKN